MVRPPISNLLRARTWCPQVTQTAPFGTNALTERYKQLIAELRRTSAMALPRCVVSRYATALAESVVGAMSGHQSWALLCRYCCRLLLAAVPKGVDRNSELKLRRHLWEMGQISDLICKVLGQQNSGPFRRAARNVQSQTYEHRGKRACALTARGSISKAMKGLDYSSHPTELGHWNLSRQCGGRRGGACLGRWKVQAGSKCDEGAGPNQDRYRFAATRQTGNGRNTWLPSSPSQEPARGDACFGSSKFSQSSGRQETCPKNVDSCSTRS